jgi:putative transposase
MSFKTCEWFNKEKKKLSSKIQYFDVIKENYDTKFFNDIIHYKSKHKELPDKIKFTKLKLTNYDKKLKNLIKKKSEMIENNTIIKESTKKANLTKITKEINNYNKVIKSRCYQIFPTKIQKNKIFKWMYECEKLYNYCVILHNFDSKIVDLDYKKSKLVIFNAAYGNNKKPAPYDILTDEIRSFCSNIKSCLTNLKNKHIKFFKLTNKKNQKSQSILIPSKSISKQGIFINLLGEMKGFDKINIDNINGDSRLIYDKITNKFFIKCPQYFNLQSVTDRKEIVALDPGEKIFMTYYSLNDSGMIGYDIKNKILKYESKIRKLQRLISKKSLNKRKIRNHKRLKLKLNIYYRKIKNTVKELHNKTALYLVRNYNRILLPSFETSNMTKCFGKKYIKNKLNELKTASYETKKKEITIMRKKKRLSKRVKFVLNQLSHYKFKQHLVNKCNEYGCELKIVTEEYTSQCCSQCGILSDSYVKRLKCCVSCNLTIDRDLNGSRNILLKNSSGNFNIRS